MITFRQSIEDIQADKLPTAIRWAIRRLKRDEYQNGRKLEIFRTDGVFKIYVDNLAHGCAVKLEHIGANWYALISE